MFWNCLLVSKVCIHLQETQFLFNVNRQLGHHYFLLHQTPYSALRRWSCRECTWGWPGTGADRKPSGFWRKQSMQPCERPSWRTMTSVRPAGVLEGSDLRKTAHFHELTLWLFWRADHVGYAWYRFPPKGKQGFKRNVSNPISWGGHILLRQVKHFKNALFLLEMKLFLERVT